MFVDSSNGSAPLVHALQTSGRRMAAIIGSSVALLSMFNDTPVRVASLRGAIAMGAVLTVTSVGCWFVRGAWVTPPEPEAAETEDGESDTTDAKAA